MIGLVCLTTQSDETKKRARAEPAIARAEPYIARAESFIVVVESELGLKGTMTSNIHSLVELELQ